MFVLLCFKKLPFEVQCCVKQYSAVLCHSVMFCTLICVIFPYRSCYRTCWPIMPTLHLVHDRIEDQQQEDMSLVMRKPAF